MKEQIPEKIAFQGVIRSMQPRSNVWRYRLDNRTHSMTGYNIFLIGVANGAEGDFSVAISEKQYEKLCCHIGDMDPEIYERYTGLSNTHVITNIHKMTSLVSKEKILFRIPYIQDFNTRDDQQKSRSLLTVYGRTETFDYFVQ